MIFLRGIHNANPSLPVRDAHHEVATPHESWVHLTQFMAMLGGAFLVLSKGNEEVSRNIRLDSPFKAKPKAKRNVFDVDSRPIPYHDNAPSRSLRSNRN
jgi:hypothetical protein